ncbi:MAG: tryptophan synthase subunit alpha [Peptococcaceae bacterium]|jgi:tryptophan synthase alpha chain|nr:tryptophan synthase subunit alpha [Peptococcaceae bacterium]
MKQPASERNRKCIEKGKLAVGYLLAGYPSREEFFDALSGCEAAGLDIFEIGYPSGNPTNDGEVIRKAHRVTDLSLQRDLDYWKKIRATVKAPVWVMAYKKDLIDTGFYRLLAQNGLADAFVIPDIAFAQRLALQEELRPFRADVLGFVAPDMTVQEQEAYFGAFALIYQQLYAGPTGMPVAADGYEEILTRAKKHENLWTFAGFGISSSERAARLLDDGFDGVVVGTAMISKLNRSKAELMAFTEDLQRTVRERR